MQYYRASAIVADTDFWKDAADAGRDPYLSRSALWLPASPAENGRGSPSRRLRREGAFRSSKPDPGPSQPAWESGLPGRGLANPQRASLTRLVARCSFL